VSRPRVALATCAALPELHSDDLALPAALDAVGVDATVAVWDDPAVDWSAYDLVVVPRMANPAAVLRWNTDKRYLVELEAAGVPIVPTTVVAPGQRYEPPAGEHVVKPTVSANAQDTRRFAAGEDSSAFAAALLDAGRAVLVQPYQRAVDEAGETAVLVFGGEVSHAARKAPVLVPDLEDPEDVEISARSASPAEVELARAAVAAAQSLTSRPLLYARVDLVPGDDGAPVLMELELTEPSLFLTVADGAVERFAAAVRAAL
jgi:glutathione synthase/RimK-type ligase-like ATP-grasp enzyme